ncbi:hypothetical protein LIER_20683 [Lithospermum erythrorhizon]|uniref:Reverse transcriptase domain-containing protein n=1 Tax=Lithospermum erythrorhizon TaxID=34254 RepID=A0AAV3QNT0_LITER
MCRDFTSINKASPKDCYPFPNIGRPVDSSADYKVMLFGLKNAGATYQRMVNKVFSTQIGRNMEIYVDDMLIKSREADDHEANLRESFENPRRVHDQPEGKRANPDKITVVRAMQSPKTQKNAQHLTGGITAMTRPVARDILLLYLVVSESALSSILIREEHKEHAPREKNQEAARLTQLATAGDPPVLSWDPLVFLRDPPVWVRDPPGFLRDPPGLIKDPLVVVQVVVVREVFLRLLQLR